MPLPDPPARAAVRVDLGHDEGDVGVHPPRRGVVDHDRPGRGDLRRELASRRPCRRRRARCRARPGRRSPRPRRRSRRRARRGGCPPSGSRRRSGSRRAGSARSARIDRMTPPTWPVAPKTPTLIPLRARPCREPRTRRRARRPSCSAAHGPVGRSPASIDAGDADRRGRDHLDVDLLGGEHLEHRRRHARVGLHPGPDDRDLRDVARRRAPTSAPIVGRQLLAHLHRRRRGRSSAR